MIDTLDTRSCTMIWHRQESRLRPKLRNQLFALRNLRSCGFAGLLLLVACIPHIARAQHSVARIWDDQLLHAISIDTARPTVHARNLFSLSTVMYDAWSAYDPTAK